MKATAVILLVFGILGVGLSFLWDAQPVTAISTEEMAAYEADTIAAHTEIESPSDEELRLQQEAQARIMARVQKAEEELEWRRALKRLLRMGGCLLAVAGVALFFHIRQARS